MLLIGSTLLALGPLAGTVLGAATLPAGMGKILLSQTNPCDDNPDPDCLSGTTLTHFTSNFDDLAANTQVSGYTNMVFNGFTVASPPRFDGHPYKNHLGPTSQPNFLRASADAAAMLPTIQSQPDQFVKLKTFNFGCYSYDPNPWAPPENAIPQACTVIYQASVTGFEAPPATLSFAPFGWWNAGLASANLTALDRDFIADTHVFSAKSASGQRLVLYIDSIDAVNYTVQG